MSERSWTTADEWAVRNGWASMKEHDAAHDRVVAEWISDGCPDPEEVEA